MAPAAHCDDGHTKAFPARVRGEMNETWQLVSKTGSGGHDVFRTAGCRPHLVSLSLYVTQASPLVRP